jgi:hypothetical protein
MRKLAKFLALAASSCWLFTVGIHSALAIGDAEDIGNFQKAKDYLELNRFAFEANRKANTVWNANASVTPLTRAGLDQLRTAVWRLVEAPNARQGSQVGEWQFISPEEVFNSDKSFDRGKVVDSKNNYGDKLKYAGEAALELTTQIASIRKLSGGRATESGLSIVKDAAKITDENPIGLKKAGKVVKPQTLGGFAEMVNRTVDAVQNRWNLKDPSKPIKIAKDKYLAVFKEVASQIQSNAGNGAQPSIEDVEDFVWRGAKKSGAGGFEYKNLFIEAVAEKDAKTGKDPDPRKVDPKVGGKH